MQHIYQDMEFRSPFFLTYLTNSLLVMYLPLWQLWLLCGSMAKKSNKTSVSSTSTINTVDDEDTLNSLHDGKLYSDTISDGSYIQIPTYANTSVPAEPKAEPYTHLDVIQVAMVIAPLYVLSNGLYNYSLFMTSVSSSTIIRYAHCTISVEFGLAYSYDSHFRQSVIHPYFHLISTAGVHLQQPVRHLHIRLLLLSGP